MARTPATSRPEGKLWVISAPSGAGKTTLVRALMAQRPRLRFSVSYTTRPQRTGETHGQDYFFVDEAHFVAMVERGEFLEHANVFGRRYGTAQAQVEALMRAGFDALLEIDWQGARQVRERMPGCRSIFVLPPSLHELERRLRHRATDEETVIRRRLAEAREDITHWAEFDFVIINDQLEVALASLLEIIDGQGAQVASTYPEHAARIRTLVAD
ncbi:MAG: guanylate kinase [Gammaproteobacteria bacterium]|nr:guanylate kinase [Gammaproteobacteria bacterium]